MKIVMDSDCLVKLAKAGLKEAIVSAMEVHIPPLVKKETVDEAKRLGYQDAFTIEEKINNKSLYVMEPKRKKLAVMSATKGEDDVCFIWPGIMTLLPVTISAFRKDLKLQMCLI